MDTIFALATAPGRAGVAVVRVSGPDAWETCRSLTGGIPAVRTASLRRLRHKGALIDEALVLVFESGESFTGERSVEFQTHGSTAVVARLLSVLSELEGCRFAEPGEFTRRALENERLDLAQVEGLADLIDAETEAQRVLAMRSFEGDLGRKVEQWRGQLLRAAALIEASIDFADEDVPENVFPEVSEILLDLLTTFRDEIRGVGAAEQVRHGFEIAIVGRPNVGKSTLLNRLAGRDAALTSEFAGTTRDVIEVRMDVSGIPAIFLDTAGVRETVDEIEALGVQRARDRANSADLRLFLDDSDLGVTFQSGDVLVRAKSDLVKDGEGLPVSGLTGAGVEELLQKIGAELAGRVSSIQSSTRERHANALERSIICLESAADRLQYGDEFAELAAEDIRGSIRAIDRLIGRIGVEDLLGEIFSSFCIGK